MFFEYEAPLFFPVGFDTSCFLVWIEELLPDVTRIMRHRKIQHQNAYVMFDVNELAAVFRNTRVEIPSYVSDVWRHQLAGLCIVLDQNAIRENKRDRKARLSECRANEICE